MEALDQSQTVGSRGALAASGCHDLEQVLHALAVEIVAWSALIESISAVHVSEELRH